MRGWRCDRCDICGDSDDEVYLPACDVCKRDTCRECTYDFQVNDDGDVTWCICQECSDDELMVPEDVDGAYVKLISASQYILFVRGELESFRAFRDARNAVIDTPGFVITEDTHQWATGNAKKWMDYAALEARKVVAS